MSKQEIVNALVDLFGYSRTDFSNQTVQDIWWYSTPQEQTAIKEYVSVQKCLVNF